MSIFLRKILFFLILISFSFISLLTIAYDIYIDDYDEVKLNYKTYLLADSHGYSLENYLEKHGIFNFSSSSDSYFDIFNKVKYLINTSDVTKIIISVDNHLLSQYREKINNLDKSIIYTSIPEYSTFFEYFKKRYIEGILLNPKIKSIFKLHLKSKFKFRTDKKEEWEDLSDSQKIISMNDRFETQFSNSEKSVILEDMFINIIDLCVSNNVEVIAIKFPLDKIYYNRVINYNYYTDRILSDPRLTFLDLSSLFLNNSNYFKDQDHLNNRGALNFSNILDSLINQSIRLAE